MCYTHSSGDRSTLSCFCQFFPLHYCYCCVYIARDIIYSIECLARLICADHNRIAFATWIQIKREFVFLFCFCCFKKKIEKEIIKTFPLCIKSPFCYYCLPFRLERYFPYEREKNCFFFQSNRSVDSTFTFMWTQFVNFTVRMTTIITSRWIYKNIVCVAWNLLVPIEKRFIVFAHHITCYQYLSYERTHLSGSTLHLRQTILQIFPFFNCTKLYCSR